MKRKGGKVVHAWAFEGDLDVAAVRSNTFTTVWPPRSDKRAEFPEVDRSTLFDAETAKGKINAAQVPLLAEVEAMSVGFQWAPLFAPP